MSEDDNVWYLTREIETKDRKKDTKDMFFKKLFLNFSESPEIIYQGLLLSLHMDKISHII